MSIELRDWTIEDQHPEIENGLIEMQSGQELRMPAVFVLPNGREVNFEAPTKSFQLMLSMKEGVTFSDILEDFYEGDPVNSHRASALISKINRFYLADTGCFVDRKALPNNDVIYQIRENTNQNQWKKQNPYLESIYDKSRKEHPTQEEIPELFLMAVRKLLCSGGSNKDTADLLDLYHRKFDARRFTRITLQTTLNHIAVKVANGEATVSQSEIWQSLADKFQISEASEILKLAKEEVRKSYPFAYEEDVLPDNTLDKIEEPTKRKFFTPNEMVALAHLMHKQTDAPLYPDASLPKSIPPYVLDKSTLILDSLSGFEGGTQTQAQLRRKALEVVIHNFSDIEGALDFLESNPVPIKSLFHWLEVNRNYAIQLYLKQVQEDPTYIPEVGDVAEMVKGAVLNDTSANSLIEYAMRVEKRKLQVVVKNLLGDSKIPEEQVFGLLESEALAKKVIGKQEKNVEFVGIPENSMTDKVAPGNLENGLKKQKTKDVEARIKDLRSEIKNLIATHLTIGLREYTLGDIENLLGLDRNQVYILQEKGFVKPTKSNGKRGDDHPIFTPKEFVSLKALQKNQRNLTPALVKQLYDLVSEEMENAAISSAK